MTFTMAHLTGPSSRASFHKRQTSFKDPPDYAATSLEMEPSDGIGARSKLAIKISTLS